MKLYHYSLQQKNEALSQRKAKLVDQSTILFSEKRAAMDGSVGASVDAIAVHLTPLSYSEALAFLLERQTPNLTENSVIYEYLIESDQLPPNLIWTLSNTEAYNKADAEIWDGVSEAESRQYARMQTNAWMRNNGHVGRGFKALEQAISKYGMLKRNQINSKIVVWFYPYVGYLRAETVQPVEVKKAPKYFTYAEIREYAKKALGRQALETQQ